MPMYTHEWIVSRNLQTLMNKEIRGFHVVRPKKYCLYDIQHFPTEGPQIAKLQITGELIKLSSVASKS